MHIGGTDCRNHNPNIVQLPDQLGERLRAVLYAFCTEQAYREWAELYVKFLRQRDPELRWIQPRDPGSEGVEAFPTHLAASYRIDASWVDP